MSNLDRCRFCLEIKDRGLIPLATDFNKQNISQIIENVYSIKISEAPALPQQICHVCLARLMDANDLRSKIEKSEEVLQESLESSRESSVVLEIEEDSDDDILEVNAEIEADTIQSDPSVEKEDCVDLTTDSKVVPENTDKQVDQEGSIQDNSTIQCETCLIHMSKWQYRKHLNTHLKEKDNPALALAFRKTKLKFHKSKCSDAGSGRFAGKLHQSK